MTEFDYNPDVASSIYSVQQALDGDVYKTADVTAKVVNKENNKQPIVSKGKQLMKTECVIADHTNTCLLYTSPSPRDLSTSRMPSSA